MKNREIHSAKAPARILVVDGDPTSLADLSKFLSPCYTVLQASSGKQALEILHSDRVSMVLSAALMAEVSGLDLLKAIRTDPAPPSIPVIMITEGRNTEVEIEALTLGAMDVVCKPLVAQVLLARVRNLLALQASAHAAEQNQKDRHQLKMQAETLRSLEREELTGVLTRQAFYRHVRAYLDSHVAQELEIARFDLDNFSTINDIMGVKAGDRLLSEIGHKVLSYDAFTTNPPVVGRIEADHFAALHKPARQPAEELFQFIQSWLSKEMPEYHTNCRFGVYTITDKSIDPAVMCDRALLALRSTKGNFTQRFARYNDSMRQTLLEEQRLTDEMLCALQSGQFIIYYQPQINYSTGEIIGAEALVRWDHPEKGMLPPSVFLPLFERNGLVTQLDNFVWEHVCRQLTVWQKRFGEKTVPISVNISRVDTYGEDLCARLTGLVEKYKLPKDLLRLEITESAYMGDAKRLCKIVEQLSQAGFIIEMDDFGSAYSSLNMLKDIAVDFLKLDMKFLSDTKNSVRSGSILSSVVRMARWLRLPVIAEGVENKQQADYLCSIGCLYMQGYYFSKPIPADQYEVFLQCHVPGKTNQFQNVDIRAAESFWDASAQTALIFNSYIGGAVILQRHGSSLEMLRANDEFFRAIHTTREKYIPTMLNVWSRFSPANQAAYNAMLDRAAHGETAAECELCSLPFSNGHSDWTRNRATLLAKNEDSELFYVSVENITAEKSAQEALECQTARLSALCNSVPCGILDYKMEGTSWQLISYNEEAWKMTGCTSREDFAQRYGAERSSAIIYSDDLSFVLQKMHQAINSGEHTALECRIVRADSSCFWSTVQLQCSADCQGNRILQSIFVDVSSRRERETQKYGKVLFSIFEKVFLLDYQADICQTLKGPDPCLGSGKLTVSLSAAIQNWISEYVLPEDQDKVSRFISPDTLRQSCAQDPIPFIDYRSSLPTGEIVLTRTSAFPVDENRFLCCCRDITKERHEEERAREIAILQATLEEQERYRIIVEQAGAAVIEWNHKTGEFFHSGNYEDYAVSGCDPKMLFQNEGKMSSVYSDDCFSLAQFFTESRSVNSAAEATLRLRMTDGSYRWTRLRGNFLCDDAGMPGRTIGTFTDVDSEVRAKEALRDTSERLEDIISNIPAGVGIYRFYPPHQIFPLYISERACQIFGFTQEEYNARIAAGIPIHFMPQINALLEKFLESAKKGESLYLPRIRATHRDGSCLWLRLTCSFVMRAHEPILCYTTILDVSNLVEAEHAADSTRELYQLLMESTDAITFDYSVAKDSLRLSFVNMKKVRTERRYPLYQAHLKSDQSCIDAASKPAVLRTLRSALSREMHGEFDFRGLGPDGAAHWYHAKFLSLAEDGSVYRLIGRIDNFDGVVSAQEARLEEALLDRVTGLRNKDSGRAAVENLLLQRPDNQFDAMLFLDVDGFKRINDSIGHLEADRILTQIGAVLKKCFRSTDVVARFGGDEFLIYMIAPESSKAVQEKAALVLDSVRAIPVGSGNFLRCSIGITGITGTLRDFNTAFHCADKAMYLSKHSGKDRYSIYHCEGCGKAEAT